MTELCKLEMAATNADELGNGWYDNNARVMESLLMRFTAMDPLCEKYPSISPYANSLCNPLRFSDPTGLDWITANYEGETFYFYDKRVKNQNDIYNLYGKGTYAKYLGESSVEVLGDSDSGESRTIGLGADGSYSIDGKSYDSEHNEPRILHIGGDSYTDMETVNNNLHGSYLEAANPMLNGSENYTYAVPPTDYQDYAAFIHDNDYDKVNAVGALGTINPLTIPADIKLIYNLTKFMSKSKSAGSFVWGAAASNLFQILLKLKL